MASPGENRTTRPPPQRPNPTVECRLRGDALTIVHAAVLGLVQGITEFLPISSSGHLILLPWLFGWPEPGLAFSVAVHMGTLVAVLGYFARDWWELFAGSARALRRRDHHDPTLRVLLALVVGTIPAAVVGLLAEDAVDAFFHATDPVGRRRATLLVAAALALVAVGLFLAERLARHHRGHRDVGLRDGLLVGIAQACALFPGVSRSGATITAGLALGLERAAAARFSFLLSAPIMVGAGLLEAIEVARNGLPQVGGGGGAFAIGFFVSAVSGLAAIHGLLRFLKNHRTDVFVVYRIVLAAVVVVLAFR